MPVSRPANGAVVVASLFAFAVVASGVPVAFAATGAAGSTTGAAPAAASAPSAAASVVPGGMVRGSGPEPLRSLETPGAGCFAEGAPGSAWHSADCGPASNVPLVVGNGRDWVGDAPTGALVGFASGGFASVSGITSERDNLSGAGEYSLQLNTQAYTCDTPYTSSKNVPNGCWVQFVLQVGAREASVFVEYWVVGYYSANHVCPSTVIPGGLGWEPYQGSCYANSAATALLVNGTPVPEPVSNLPNLQISGLVYVQNGTTYDEAVVTDRSVGPNGTSWSATVPDDPLALAGNWMSVEFNVLGYGDRSEALFNAGAGITVTTTTESPTGDPIEPVCQQGGYTAETSNLSLGSCSTYPPDHLTFTEMNPPSGYRRATFVAKVLPPGTTWWVNVTSGPSTDSAGSIVNLWLPRGIYNFTVTSANRDYVGEKGTFRLGGYGLTRVIRFSLTVYKVTFAVNGLPPRADWCVAVAGGKRYCSLGYLRTFSEPNGTYNYTLSTPRPGYAGPAGSFVVSGAIVSTSVTFSTAS